MTNDGNLLVLTTNTCSLLPDHITSTQYFPGSTVVIKNYLYIPETMPTPLFVPSPSFLSSFSQLTAKKNETLGNIESTRCIMTPSLSTAAWSRGLPF
jgi:hypothetical protein